MTPADLDVVPELPAIDLDVEAEDPTPMFDQRLFDAHYAQLAFGLGTVRRRARRDDAWWETAPGILGIVAAVIGLLLLAAS